MDGATVQGVVLPHEHFGSYLESLSKPVDEQLERQNFQHAWEILAEIWSNTTLRLASRGRICAATTISLK
ncbi:hypothetical protein PoB_001943500 [Plakobranchus ocellatus]|uniref:Uncharacterized protein n=1 Tax=Plakobranchus ocellatus TaxID=259542 RepID=A0AAV3ZBL6_9GAST|nr:hypothetical protein PoB_001943500 [Plakobranchus ocellatus]